MCHHKVRGTYPVFISPTLCLRTQRSSMLSPVFKFKASAQLLKSLITKTPLGALQTPPQVGLNCMATSGIHFLLSCLTPTRTVPFLIAFSYQPGLGEPWLHSLCVYPPPTLKQRAHKIPSPQWALGKGLLVMSLDTALSFSSLFGRKGSEGSDS